MSSAGSFQGFSRDTLDFYAELALNNDRAWFEHQRERFRSVVLQPAADFVAAMAERLRLISPYIVADPRTNGSGSIFRIHRDTRFSKDKTPFKTYLGILFWEGSRPKMENSGFYFHLEPNKLLLYAGIYEFTAPLLARYRDAVVHSVQGAALARAAHEVIATGRCEIGGRHYKRIPAGYDPDHPNAEFLFHRALYASTGGDLPTEIFSPQLLDYCLEHFTDMAPLHSWIVSVLEGDAGAAQP
jgi:uncharacterized protein (TIGR02453 family)